MEFHAAVFFLGFAEVKRLKTGVFAAHDFDGLHGDFVDGRRALDSSVGNLIHEFHALDRLAEDGVLIVQMRRGDVADEELRAGAVGIGRACHRERARLMLAIVELGIDRPARAAHPGPCGVAALNHESFNHAMKDRAVVKFAVGEVLEISDMIGSLIRIELGDDRSRNGAAFLCNFNYGDAVSVHRIIGGPFFELGCI